MLSKRLLTLLMIMTLVTMACSISLNLPVQKITTGVTQTEQINVPEPDADSADVTLTFGAGELRLSPGSQTGLISGLATYNVEGFKPEIKTNGERVSLETGDLEIRGIPNFSEDIKNDWDLQLSDMPMDLTINAGAYSGVYEFGDLALKSLEINDGAADVRLKFSKSNRIEMDTLRYVTGASNLRLSGLANANFTSMIFRSGAGDYSLDFSGQLTRDAVVTIESGISHVVISVPEGVAARVYFKGGLSNVTSSGEWTKSGDQYILKGSGPELTFNVDMAAGNLELKTE